LQRDGEMSDKVSKDRLALLSRMDNLRREIGHVGTTTADLVEEGRRR
jgi:hypothetical protein